MLLLILKRIGLGLITLFIVSLITFVGVEVLPGDACTTYLEREAYGAALDACIKRLGLDIPAYERYLDWASNVVRGDFGLFITGYMGWQKSTICSNKIHYLYRWQFYLHSYCSVSNGFLWYRNS